MRAGLVLCGEEGKRFAMGLIGGCCARGRERWSARLVRPFGREVSLSMPLGVEGRTRPGLVMNERMPVIVKR